MTFEKVLRKIGEALRGIMLYAVLTIAIPFILFAEWRSGRKH